MDLRCKENIPPAIYAEKDPVILKDFRALDNLLRDERFYTADKNYFEEVQTDIAPYMRKVVTMWMLEVCEEQRCEDQVLPLAISCMDRFLCVCPIKREQLQLLGAVCLLIASKFRCASCLPIDLLSAYTDRSISCEHIQDWEILVLSKLEWNISGVTGFDFVDQIIEKCSWGNDNQFIRRHALTLVSIIYTEPSLIQTPPSAIAAACICSAVRGLKLACASQTTRDICRLTRVDPINLELLIRFVDEQVEKVLHPESETKPSAENKHSTNNGYESPTYGQPETPTEVENVYF